MSMSNFNLITDKIIANEKSITKKRQEIEKRREVVETTSSTNLAKKKESHKIEKLDNKITAKSESFDQTITYYKTEIEKSEKKCDSDCSILSEKIEKEIDVIRQKAEAEICKIRNRYDIEKKKLEEKFYNYREYCLSAIQVAEEKKEKAVIPFERTKEVLQESLEKSEEDDKVLVRLKVELKQLLDDQKELDDEFKKHQESVALQQKKQREEFRQQEEEKFRAIQREELERARVEKEQRDELERQRKEEKWSAQKEQRVQEIKEEKEKEVTKQQDKTTLRRFQLEIYPKLSDKAVMIYNFLKDATDPHKTYKDVHEFETVDETEEFLSKYEDTYTKITSYCNKLSEEQQLEFESLSLSEQLRRMSKNTVPTSSGNYNLIVNTKTKKK